MPSFLTALFSLPILISALLIIRRYATTLISQGKRNGVPRPPLVANWLPFIGSALQMGGGDAFWTNVKRTYGPAFRVLAMGETRIFVTSPALINHVYKNSKSFDFSYFRKHMQSFIFGMARKSAFAQVVEDRLFEDHHRAMQPGAIAGSIKRYADLLEMRLRGRADDLDEKKEVDGVEAVYDIASCGDWEERNGALETDLVDFVFDIMYTASSKAFFSSSFPAAETKETFRAFDRAFPILNLSSLPSLLRNPALAVREKILVQIEGWWVTTTSKDRAEFAPVIDAMLDAASSEDWSKRDWSALILAELWALEANAPYAGIWTLAEILRRPELLSSLRGEIDNAIKTLSPPTLSTLLHLPQAELVTVLPNVNAALQETLRFHTSTGSFRIVQSDSILPPALCGNETGFSLGKGEEVICMPRASQVSNEGDWGYDADRWDPERFVASAKKTRGSMMPFGGGVSMCEGRHFASAEILTFLAAILHLADLEIVPGTDHLQHDMQRIGLGIMQPKGNMRVRLRTRT